MLKQKVLKRVLPIMLSLAMVLQSVPMTAMAAEENPQAAELTEEAEVTVEPVTEAAEDLSDSEADEAAEPDEGAAADIDTDTSEGDESADGQPETETGAEVDTKTETETGTETETETGTETKVETEEDQELTATGTGTDAAQSDADARIEVSSTEIDITQVDVDESFESVVGEDSLTYTTSYSEEDQFDGVMDRIKKAVEIKVNGEGTPPDFKNNYLTLEWREAGKEEAMTGTPRNVGSYVLHLQVKAQEGICGDAACDICFRITPKELKLDEEALMEVLSSVKAGSSVADFKEAVAEACVLTEKDNSAFTALQYSVAVKVSEVGAEEGKETTDAVFLQSKDYRAAIEVTFADAEAGKNYELSGAEYPVNFDGLLETKVEIAKPVQEIVKTYVKDTKYKASEIAPEIRPEVKAANGEDMEGNTTYEPLPADVTVKDAVAKWYQKEINKDENGNGGIADFPTEVDGITQFFGEDGALYTLMTAEDGTETAEVGDVGDYYLVFVYEGVEGRYAPSHSDPLKVAINPIEVILKPEKIVGSDGAEIKLSTAMTADDIESALAKVESKLYVPDTADSTAYGTESDAPAADKDFYGVSYDNAGVTQYYSPVFELVRKTRSKSQKAPGATEEPAWGEWKWDTKPVTTIEKNTDSKEYQYFVKFTGQKAVYTAAGVKTSERPISEATDAANRNYQVKADSDTLDNEKNMLPVVLGEVKETTIDVSGIIAEFNKEGGRGKGGAGLTADDPAWTIYDMDAALFEGRESYKKAKVQNAEPAVEGTHKDLTYTWQESNRPNLYYEITRMKPEEGETAEAFAERKKEAIADLEATFETFESDFSAIPQDAGLYRLHVHYEDSDLNRKNTSADGYAYFLIKKQELMLAADTQFAKYGDSVWDFSKNGYRMYLLPDNKEEGWKENENLLDWQRNGLNWQAMNKKKNADGSDTDEWENSTGTFIKKDAPYAYTYKAAVWLDEDSDDYYAPVYDTDDQVVTNEAGQALRWSNYTTRDMSAWDADEEEYRHHYKVGDGFGDFQFDAAGIKVVVDRSKMPAGKTYDGKPIDVLIEDLVSLTDENGASVSPEKLQINGEPKENVGTVRVEWKWTEATDEREWDRTMPTEEVKFGGTYRLVASFDGYHYADGTSYAPLQGVNEGEYWTEWLELKDADGKPYEVTISPLKVDITPALRETMTAGDRVSDMLEDHVLFDEKIVPEEDRWLFDRGSGSRWNAIDDWEEEFDGYPILGHYDWEDGEPYDGEFTAAYYADNKPASGSDRIRSGKEYKVTIGDNGLFAQYGYSYELAYKPAELKKIVRGDADVWGTDFFRDENYGTAGVDVYRKEKNGEGVYEILPREGIPFVYDNYGFVDHNENEVRTDLITGEKIPRDKNYIAVKIVSPREFASEFGNNNFGFADNNFVYGNSIKSAGGYVIDRYGAWDGNEGINRYFITALFPVELDESGKAVEIPAFDVTWEKGYKDTFAFNLAGAQVEANLKRAVAPKSLAFNGVQSKMAVGEEQQLDVKITKAQLGDVIRINYRLAGGATSNEYASINPETGLITALATNNKKPTAVAVEAYPVRLAADGKTFEEITGKGVKIAKTKVTVTEVTAPVIKKVIPKDTSAEVQFTQVDNGYRGEIYVKKFDDKASANKYRATNFEEEIGKLKNGQWQGTFAVKPMYFSGTRGYDEKLKLCRKTIGGLERGFYVVYVRNVSAVRTLPDGTKTTESAAGTAKMFETTKSQVRELHPYFEVVDPKTKTNPVRYKNGVDEYDGYTVELADKSAQLLVEGEFLDLINAGADKSDKTWYQLSLKAAEKALGTKLTDTYLDPKLAYYVTDGVNPDFDENHKLKNPSKYVTINNKGKLAFKGVDKNGELNVRIYVEVADNTAVSGYCDLTITARPDTVTSKKVKPMKVGDAIRLRDYLEYKTGKAKVPNYWSSSIEITNWDEAESNGFWVYRYGDDDNADRQVARSIDGELRDGEIIIVAKREDARWDLKLKDWLWKSPADSDERVENELSISLATAKLDPVKGLKAVYTDDKHITLNFAHPGHPEAFDIEVKDARGSLIYKKLAYRENALSHTIEADAKAWEQNKQRAILDDFTYFEKTKTYAYTISTEKLMRLSSYKISVTPVYDDVKAAKAATANAKTTNIPASYENCDIENPDYTSGSGLEFNDYEPAYLVSGNIYTVTAEVDWLAKTRGTDTLTWKSSNGKVASIKANPGSFSATLKALQQGRTTITVTSKVTKKTIARYHLAVKAVGKGSGYGGDYENGGNDFYDGFILTVDPYYEGRMEVLTVSNSVTVTDEDFLNDPSNDRTWVKFTAPSYGEYTFNCDKNYEIYYSDATEVTGGSYRNKTLRLEEGQEIYFKVYDTFTLRVSSYLDFTKLTPSFTEDKPLVAGKDGAWVSFTAPEDNYYTFNGNMTLQFEQDGKYITIDSEYDNGRYSYKKGMKADETIFIKVNPNGRLWVTKREFAQTALTTGGEGVKLAITRDNADDTQYLKFTAEITGEHTFTYSPDDKIDVAFYGLGDDDTIPTDGTGAVIARAKALNVGEDTETPAENPETSVKLFIEKGETIAIAVTAKNPSEITGDTKIEANVKAAAPVGVKTLIVGEQEAEKAKTQMFEYTIPNDKAAAEYILTATENADITWYYGRTEKDVNGGYFDSSKKLASLSAIADNGNRFKVKEGTVIEPNLTGNRSLHAGDKIYIEVKVAEDAAANSKVTLTRVTADGKVFDTTAPATVVLGADAGSAEWYTFKAKKSGYYEFTRKVTVAPETSTAQSVTVATVREALSTSTDGKIIFYGNAPAVRKLDAGDYVFMIQANSDAAAEGDKTTVVLSAKEIVPTPLAAGENTVGPITKGETKYYTFKAAKNETYTIKWESGTDVGNPTAEYTTGDLAYDYDYSSLGSVSVDNRDTYTIRLKADDAKDLSGKLQVTATTTEFLKSGVAKDFEIAENGGTVNYKFTLPEDSVLGYVVTVENTSVADESKGQLMPTISVGYDDSSSNIVSNLGKGKKAQEIIGWNKALTTETIQITANNVTGASEGVTAIKATGKITIKPITVNPFTAAVGKVNKGDEPKWYTWSVNADERYQLGYTVGENQDKGSVDVVWYRKSVEGSEVYPDKIYSEMPYLTKGTELYVKVSAKDTIADAGVDVTLDPKPVTATALTLTDGKAEVDVTAEMVAKGAVYYTFVAPDYAGYTVENSAYTCLYVPENDDGEESDYWSSGYSLEKGQKILIEVTTAGKLTVTQNKITELKLDTPSGEITLEKNGGSASFVLNIFKDGYYDFRVSDAGGLGIEEEDFVVYQETEGKCYFVADISQEYSDRYEFTITNGGVEDAKINVTAGTLTPVTLKMGENSVPAVKNRASVVEFRVPESYWYTLGCSAGSKMHLAGVEGVIEGSKDEFLPETGVKEDPQTGVLLYSGTEDSATATVTISKLAPAPASGEKIAVSLEDGASVWYAYKTDKAGNYTIKAPEGISLYYYSSLEWGPENQSCPSGGSLMVKAGVNADVYIKAVNNSGAKVEGENANITVTCEEAMKLNAGENPLNNSAYDPVYLTFTAAEDGMYSFDLNGSGNLNYYGENAWSGNPQYASSSSSFFVRKDSVVYLQAYSDYGNNTVTVKRTGDAAFLGHVDVNAGKYQWVTFTAPEAGDYTFAAANVENNSYAWFIRNQADVGNNATFKKLDSVANSDSGWGSVYWYNGSSNTRRVSLEEGETVNIAVGGYYLQNKTSCDVYVKQ